MANLATDFINDVYSYGNTGSSMANAVSSGAQQNQFDFNAQQAQLAYEQQKELASMQMAYNSAAAAEQRNYNEAMWAKSVQANRENMEAQQAFNHAEAILAREFSAQEAEKQRAFNSAEAGIARNFNSTEAEKNRAFNKAEAEIAREFSAKEAQTLRNWQERMSNTAYQRAVQDMKSAGINPILAYAQGGAGTPSGGMGSSSSASGSMASAGPASGSIANSAMASSGLASAGMASTGMQSIGMASAPQASGSTFTGQGNNMSENLAIFGAIASMFGQGMSGLAESIGLFGQSLNLTEFARELGKLFNPQDEENKDKGWGDGEVSLEDFGLKETGGGMIGLLKNIQLALFGRTKGNHESGGGAGHKF